MLRLSFLDLLEDRDAARIVDATGVIDRSLFNQQQFDFFFRDWTVLDAARDHDEFARIQNDLAIAQFDDELAFDDIEQLVFFLVRVPDELAFDLGDLHVCVIDGANDLR